MESVRTCLGCRQRDNRSSLVRVVARDGRVVVDSAAREAGRGAWVHPASTCVTTAITRKSFGRALRAIGALDASTLLADLDHQFSDRITEQAERHMDN